NAKKQAARKAARAQGDANAAKFGRRKDERDLQAAREDQDRARLDGHKRDRDND
ncbi:MAG: DUF4169 family protein, partial [Rhodobacteraceae bacterium]|nr:DUF4169 family protein [Paracoccaceae bacterium]